MSEKDVCSDEKVLEILWKKEAINHMELKNLLYRLCHTADNSDCDSMQNYTHLSESVYDSRIVKIFNFISESFNLNCKVFYTKEVTKDDIKDQVDCLPELKLIQFLKAYNMNYFIFVDYEAPDEVYGCDYLLDILMDTSFNRMIHLIPGKEIRKIIDFIDDLDLFDVELYNLKNSNMEEIKTKVNNIVHNKELVYVETIYNGPGDNAKIWLYEFNIFDFKSTINEIENELNGIQYVKATTSLNMDDGDYTINVIIDTTK